MPKALRFINTDKFHQFPGQAVSRLESDEYRTIDSIDSAGGRKINCVNLYGLFNLILGNRKQGAGEGEARRGGVSWVSQSVINLRL